MCSDEISRRSQLQWHRSSLQPRFTSKGRLEESLRGAPSGCMHAHTHTHVQVREGGREGGRDLTQDGNPDTPNPATTVAADSDTATQPAQQPARFKAPPSQAVAAAATGNESERGWPSEDENADRTELWQRTHVTSTVRNQVEPEPRKPTNATRRCSHREWAQTP